MVLFLLRLRVLDDLYMVGFSNIENGLHVRQVAENMHDNDDLDRVIRMIGVEID